MKDKERTNKSERVYVRVTTEEKAGLEAAASAAHKSVSEYLLDMGTHGACLDYAYLRQAVYQLGRIGTNINQAVRIMNTYYAEADNQFDYVLDEFKTLKDYLYSLPPATAVVGGKGKSRKKGRKSK